MTKTIGDSEADQAVAKTVQFHNELVGFLSQCPITPVPDSLAGKELLSYQRPESLRTAYSQGAVLAQASLDHLTGFLRTMATPALSVSPFAIVRCAMESAAMSVWLLGPAIGAQKRVERSLAFRYEDLRQQQKFAQAITDMKLVADIEERIEEVANLAHTLGYSEIRSRDGKRIGIAHHIKEKTVFVDEVLHQGSNYRILSGMAHGLPSPIGQLSYKTISEVTHPEGDTGHLRESQLAPVAAVWLCYTIRDLLHKVIKAEAELFGWDQQGLARIKGLVSI